MGYRMAVSVVNQVVDAACWRRHSGALWYWWIAAWLVATPWVEDGPESAPFLVAMILVPMLACAYAEARRAR